jgi:hypothetical protein
VQASQRKLPIIKPAQNTNTTQKQHKYTKQKLNKQTDKRKQYYGKRYIRVLGQNANTLKKRK